MATNNDPFSDYDSMDDDIGLDPEDRATVRSGKAEWYRAEKGRVDRASFLYFNNIDVTAIRRAKKANASITKDEMTAVGQKALVARAAELHKSVSELTPVDRLNLNDVRFKKVTAHYQEGLGYVVSRLGLDGPEYDAVWRTLPEPKQYYTTLLLVYPTTRDGSIIKDSLLTGWKLLPWRFSPERYQQIYKRNVSLVENGITLASQDITIECKDTNFQNVSVDGAGPALYRKSDKFKDVVLTAALSLYDKLNPFREMTSTDLKIKLNMASGGAVSNVSTEDYGDLLDKV